MNQYWKLFRRHAHAQHFFLLLIGTALVVVNVIGFLSADSGIINVLWGGLGVYIIVEIFRRLKRKDMIQQQQQNTSTQPAVQTSMAQIPTISKKDFWNYFALILFIINVILVEFGFAADLELGSLIVLLHTFVLIASFPIVVFAFTGKWKLGANVIAGIIYGIPIPVYIFIFDVFHLRY